MSQKIPMTVIGAQRPREELQRPKAGGKSRCHCG